MSPRVRLLQQVTVQVSSSVQLKGKLVACRSNCSCTCLRTCLSVVAVDQAAAAGPSSGSTASTPARPGKLRFTLADDIQLAREVALHDRPFKHGSKAWEGIAAKMTGHLKNVAARTLRDRVIHLVKLHQQGQATSMKQ